MYLSWVNQFTLHAAQCLVARMLKQFGQLNASTFFMFTRILAHRCVVYTAISKMHFFSQGYFLETENLHYFFKNEQTNLLSILKGGHEGSLLIFIDNCKK